MTKQTDIYERHQKVRIIKAVVEAHKSKQFMLDGVVSIGGANVALLEALQDSHQI